MKTLHGVILSPYVRKVRIMLEEKNVAYALNLVIPFNAPADFKKISPLGKIPVLSEGDLNLADSSVIAAYLEKAHPEQALYPVEAVPYAQALWFEEYADTALAQVTLRKIFMPKIVAPALMGKALDINAITEAVEKELPPLLDYLEAQIKGKSYFVGDNFTIADISVISPLVNYLHAGYSLDTTCWPHLAAYLQQQLERPSFKKCLIEEQAFMQNFLS